MMPSPLKGCRLVDAFSGIQLLVGVWFSFPVHVSCFSFLVVVVVRFPFQRGRVARLSHEERMVLDARIWDGLFERPF